MELCALQHALNIALEAPGIGVDGEYEIVEYPEPGLFGFKVWLQDYWG